MTNTATNLRVGERVQIVLADDDVLYTTRWYPRGEVFGIVQRIFKNGNVAVAIEGLHNRSADGLHTMHFKSGVLDASGVTIEAVKPTVEWEGAER